MISAVIQGWNVLGNELQMFSQLSSRKALLK